MARFRQDAGQLREVEPHRHRVEASAKPSADQSITLPEIIAADEAGLGERGATIERLNALGPLHILEVRDDALALTPAFIWMRAVPQGAVDHALHIATVAVHGVEYLAKRDLKHVAHAESIARVEQVCKNQAYTPIIIGVPRQLMSKQHD